MGIATEQLRADHTFILRVLDSMEMRNRHIREESVNEIDTYRNFIRFCRDFVDGCHHYREEQCLFPSLNSFGLSSDHGPVAVMLHEHQIGRELLSAMELELVGVEAGSSSMTQVAQICEDFCRHLRQHIFKEDNILFKMADQILEGDIARETRSCYDDQIRLHMSLTETELLGMGRSLIDEVAHHEQD